MYRILGFLFCIVCMLVRKEDCGKVVELIPDFIRFLEMTLIYFLSPFEVVLVATGAPNLDFKGIDGVCCFYFNSS